MSSAINWSVMTNDAVLSTPQYQKWSRYTYTELIPEIMNVKSDLGAALASNESAAVVNYLSGICRVVALIA